MGHCAKQRSAGTDLQGGTSRSKGTEAWTGGRLRKELLRGTWGLTEKRGGARGHRVGKETLASPRSHGCWTSPRGTRSAWIGCIISRTTELFAVRQIEGGQSFQRLGSPVTWVGLCPGAANPHSLGNFVSAQLIFLPVIKSVYLIHNTRPNTCKSSRTQTSYLPKTTFVNSFYFLRYSPHTMKFTPPKCTDQSITFIVLHTPPHHLTSHFHHPLPPNFLDLLNNHSPFLSL